DNNSKNGVRINGERVDRIELRPGLVFYIGDQGFKVEAPAEDSEETRPAIVRPPDPAADDATRVSPIPSAPRNLEDPASPAATPPTPLKKKRWHQILAAFLDKNSDHFVEQKRPLAPLTPAVVLEFMHGMQSKARWVVGYGPRKIGAQVLDLPIWEPGAPA